MNKRWRVHVETLADVDETVQWYDAQRAGLGVEFLEEVRATVAMLQEDPARGTVDGGVHAGA